MRRRLVVVLSILLTLAGLAVPQAATAHADATLVAARSAVFGEHNVDQTTGALRADRIVFSWFGVSGFAVAMAGHVFLTDAWVPNVYTGHVPTSRAQIAAIKPSHIFIGHGHFDHAADAAEIARASGARIVGSARTAPTSARPRPVCPAMPRFPPAHAPAACTSTRDYPGSRCGPCRTCIRR